MLRMICEEDPPKPSTRVSTLGEELTSIAKHRSVAPKHLRRLIRGDLDWIVMKALEKERGRRYESASGVAADIQRCLNSEPVVACPPTAAYRNTKVRASTSGFCRGGSGRLDHARGWDRRHNDGADSCRGGSNARQQSAG